MKEIKLTQGYVALVDDEDYNRCMGGPTWYANVDRRKDGTVRKVYARRHIAGKIQYLHRFLLGITDPEVQVDHKNHNGLNNQRYNLRTATCADNQHNHWLHTNNTSGFKGVAWSKRDKKWNASVTVGNRQLYIGLFPRPEDAARAYDEAAIQHFGQFAKTNAALGLLS
jgi:hypothetical protein